MKPDIISPPAAVSHLQDLRICIKGAGDLATGVAVRLYRSGFTRILMLETEVPLAVRRAVSFSEAVYCGEKIVEGLLAVRTENLPQVQKTAQIEGLVRGLLRGGKPVASGTKLGDIDPRKELHNCNLVSDKATALGGGVLEAILETFMTTHT